MTACGTGGDGTGTPSSGSTGVAGRTLIYLWPLGGEVHETLPSMVGKNVVVHFNFDGGGSTLTADTKIDVYFPTGGDAYTIISATLLADQTGSIVVDLWKDTYANFPPTVADTITASAKPTITSATKSQDTTLTGWTTAISADDVIRANINSVSTIQRCSLTLHLQRNPAA